MMYAEFVRTIDACLDDDLSIMEIVRAHGHLISCERCHRIMASEGMLHDLLTNDTAQDLPPGSLPARILRRVIVEEVEASSKCSGARSRPAAFAVFPGVQDENPCDASLSALANLLAKDDPLAELEGGPFTATSRA